MEVWSQFLIVISVLFFGLWTDAYVMRGYTDTSDGYCDLDCGRIPVGGYGYDDERCEKVICDEREYQRLGCGAVSDQGLPKGCQLVAKGGHYPNCCRQFVECEDNNSDDENSGEDDSSSEED